MLNLLNDQDKKYLMDYLEHFFGMNEDVFEDTLFYSYKESIWALKRHAVSFLQKTNYSLPQGLKICSGLKIYKPTYDFAQNFGHFCKKGFLELAQPEALDFFNRKDILLHGEDLERGYLLIKYKKLFIGVGFFDGDRLVSHYPKKLCSQISSKNFR